MGGHIIPGEKVNTAVMDALVKAFLNFIHIFVPLSC